MSCAQLQSFRGQNLPPEVSAGSQALNAGDAKAADIQFQKVFKSNNLDDSLAVVVVCQSVKNWPLTMKYADQALLLFPKAEPEKQVFLLMSLGTAHLNLGESKKATENAEQALKVLPDHFSTLNGLGYMYAEVYDPERPGEMIKLLTAVKMIDSAIAKAREANISDPEMGALVDSQGWVQYKLKSYKDSVSILNRAATLAPDQPELQYHLGMALIKVENRDQALIALERAIKLEPGFKAAIAAKMELTGRPVNIPKPNILQPRI